MSDSTETSPRFAGGRRRALLVALASTVLIGAAAFAVSSGGRDTPAPVPGESTSLLYLTLGDSHGQGVQPDPARDLKGGYARALRDSLGRRFGAVAWSNGSCGGATTTSIFDASRSCIPDVPVEYSGNGPDGSQLAWAAALLRSRADRPTLVTLTIGGNDVIECAGDDTALLRRCLDERSPVLRRNWETIARTLAQAAGPRTVLAVATSYDPTVAWLKADPERFAEPISVFHRFVTEVMNPTMRASFSRHGWLIADLGRAFGERGRLTADAPVVRRVCRLTWACENGDIHLNDEGYRVLAELFGRTVEPALQRAVAGTG